jgi:hypothetical protein
MRYFIIPREGKNNSSWEIKKSTLNHKRSKFGVL